MEEEKTPLFVIFIEERVAQGKLSARMGAGIIRAYNNIVAKLWSWGIVFLGIAGYAMYEIFIMAKDFSDLLNGESWKAVILIVVKELLDLAKSSYDKAKRTK